MISKELHAQLMAQWKKLDVKGPIYAEYHRFKLRIPHLEQNMEDLRGKRILEIGSNAGMHAYTLAPIAESYVGVEPGDSYYAQAMCTLEHIDSKNARFIHSNIPGFIKNHLANVEFNAFFAAFALYHFLDKELEMLDEHVWPKCDVVHIQNRNQRRPTPHNTKKFWKEKNIRKYFTARGFECTNYWGPEKKFSEVICIRK